MSDREYSEDGERPVKRSRIDVKDTGQGDTKFAQEIAELCYSAYQALPGKSGKATSDEEYTILACIVRENVNKQRNVVALATGTKCFPENVADHNAQIVDCHAEPLLKRAFKCHLSTLLREHLSAGGTLEQFSSTVSEPNLYFLFVSQTPCGTLSRWKGENDVKYRKEARENGEELRNYKSVGVNRKPGRGPLCPSAGCIHKIAKWCHFGLQGKRLLGLMGFPIRPHRIVIGGCEEFENPLTILDHVFARITPQESEDDIMRIEKTIQSPECLKLATLFQRTSLDLAPDFRQKDLMRCVLSDLGKNVECSEKNSDSFKAKRPTCCSVVSWVNDNSEFEAEKLASGRRLGAGKKSKIMSKVCNKALEQRIERILEQLDSSAMSLYKERILAYEDKWKLFKNEVSIFRGWPEIDVKEGSSTQESV